MRLTLCRKEYNKFAMEGSRHAAWRRRITKGQSVTYTLSDGKKIQKVTDVVTGTGVGGESSEFSASVKAEQKMTMTIVAGGEVEGKREYPLLTRRHFEE
jgi:hypothetical protein